MKPKSRTPIIRETVSLEMREINTMHDELVAMGTKMLSRMIAIGERLSAIKDRIEHGFWEDWVGANLSFTTRTARRYMNVYQHRDDPVLKDDPEAFISRLYGNASETEMASRVTVEVTHEDVTPSAISYSRDPRLSENDQEAGVGNDGFAEPNRTPESESDVNVRNEKSDSGPAEKDSEEVLETSWTAGARVVKSAMDMIDCYTSDSSIGEDFKLKAILGRGDQRSQTLL
jgi:Protein of unknown function (DUF3102)